MSSEPALVPLAESIADGSPVDWDAAESRARGEERAVIRQLRVLATLAALHRSLPSSPNGLGPASVARRANVAPAIGSWAHLALLERLGGGTFGEVYRAWDRHLEREVALKLLRVDESTDDPQSSRIAMEGRLLARVRHPNVITVHGVAVHDGRVGLWMELVRGVTLEQLLLTRGPFGAREAALIGIDSCRALAAIHAAGLIHRDVKAQNVMREDGGRIVLMDLGTGREIDPTRHHPWPDLAGTPLYLAPEIFAGAPASERSDLYSLGVLLYHLVTGSFPVRATTIEELQEGHAKGTGVRLRDARADLPTAFVRVVGRTIASDPDRRYATAGALEADLALALDDTAAPAAGGTATAKTRAWPSAWRTGALAATLIVMLGLAAILWPVLRGRQAPATAAPGLIRSIAVLPLANLSGDPAQEYFVDGMTDELIATLGRIGQLNVISRTSVTQFKGSSQLLPEIARRLNVDAVLEGSVLVTPGNTRQEPNAQKRVRINARLILAGTDMQLWNHTFEHVLTDIFALQSEVASAVAEEINLQLTSDQRRELAGSGSQNPEAQEAYLQGRSYLTNSARDSLMQARRWLERAVSLDPKYARAQASLAVCYVWLELVGAMPRAEARTRATAAAKRALQLDPRLSEAHGVLADIELFYDWDWAGAGAAYRRALELNPSYSFARGQYAWYLAAMGRLDEALRQAKLAEEADPLTANAKGAVGMMLFYNRKYDEAIPQFQKALALAPGGAQEHNGLARAYAAKRAFPEAVSELQEAVRLSGEAPPYLAELARTYAAAGNPEKARELLARLQQIARTSQAYVTSEAFGYIYAALGEREQALDFLEQAVRDHSPAVLWAKVDPRLDGVRQDARFVRLLQRIGVPAPR